ncbi:MAG: aconitate hydratase AcnA [Gammaproteobacteria bacterium]|nr:aconitate hydratase AcnA [Gammaproteobacteria bacterium]MBT4655159.1 aconitate hydratase AcnA [Gammaproteobacteria bacterium]MBT5761411.1 aconitate hydratase AcnA [Gammaproteobacteria bacterium]MBT7932715.1 aconitate hydratase AcnA [Gammaproteobacteria bacterium]
MDFKDKVTHIEDKSEQSYDIYNINKADIKHLPYSLRVLFENYVRNNKSNIKEVVNKFLSWNGSIQDQTEITFYPSRVIMQDFTGVPAVVDLASMRDAVKELDGDPSLINPQCQTDLIIDHSVMVDHYGTEDSKDLNTQLEYKRNIERYRLLKWGQGAFRNLRIVPPNNGIIHQINIEYISQVIFNKDKTLYPDTVVGTDSHTTMVNGLGVLGWGVGGIEAEAAMLGQPIPMLLPEVIGFNLTGKLSKSTTATDLVLTIVEQLRKANVVGKFVEFYGDALDHLSIADRCTIANMAPEYGATCGFFPIDDMTLSYMDTTGKDKAHVKIIEEYSKKVGLFRNDSDKIIYSNSLSLDISTVQSCLSGPKRPEDRVNLGDVKTVVTDEIKKQKKSKHQNDSGLADGAIMIAAITSCTNTSNPSVIIGAGLLAKKAVEKGLKVKDWVKTSLAPGSRVVKNYLEKAKLSEYFDKLGFNIIGYGCTTCIGNSGPLKDKYTDEITNKDLIVSSILSGNRNFEGRIHPEIKMNFLASPMLVIAYSLVGQIGLDISTESLGKDTNGKDVYLDDIWPSSEEIASVVHDNIDRKMFTDSYSDLFEGDSNWKDISTADSEYFDWQDDSTYIQPSPFFENINEELHKLESITNAYPLLILGDSVTTDHISPAGSFKDTTPAGKFLVKNGTQVADFNSYGSRRGNYRIMQRGTFANIRIANKLVPETTGGFTLHLPSNEQMPIFDAAEKYRQSNDNLIVFAGKNYGCGSSRDWAAKGTKLLGVKAVIAESFERIHRSNLVGMGVLPLEYMENETFESLGLDKLSQFTINKININDKVVKVTTSKNNSPFEFNLKIRIDTAMEWNYFMNDGILNYVLKNIASS